jgi:hypothetical protein
MTFYTARISQEEDVKNYIILSRDKASVILSHLLKTENLNVNHFKDIKNFETFIQSL